MADEVGPLLVVLRQLIDEWQGRGVSMDYVPAAREAYMRAAEELADRLPASERPEPRNINVDVLGMLNEIDRALNERRTQWATVELLRLMLTATSDWPPTGRGRWIALAGRAVQLAEAEIWR
jgi:hypothetical protein